MDMQTFFSEITALCRNEQFLHSVMEKYHYDPEEYPNLKRLAGEMIPCLETEAGWQVKIVVAHGAHFLIVFIILYPNRKTISKVQILSFGLFCLPWGCGADGDGMQTDPVFFGDVFDVAVVDVHKAAAV